MPNGFALAERGHRHKKDEIPCQDAAACKLGDDYALAALSDGHSPDICFRSGQGSELAVQTALTCLEEFAENHRATLKDPRRRFARLRELAGRIIYEWQICIEKHFAGNPLDEREKGICAQYGLPSDIFQEKFYGATLLYACLMPGQSFASQIGDGAIVFFNSCGNPEKLPIDPYCINGVTTSLSDLDALENFQHHIWDVSEGRISSLLNLQGMRFWQREASEGLPQAFFLYSDGVVDAYEPNSFLAGFNVKLLECLKKHKESALEDLRLWLPDVSERSDAKDDVSIAGLYCDDEPEPPMANKLDSAGGIVKGEKVLFYLIDQSESMTGDKIGAVNAAIRETIPVLKTAGGADVKLKVAVLLFSDGCRWMYPQPIDVEDFAWEPLETGGLTDFGAALNELAEKLSQASFMPDPATKHYTPAFILMSDGMPSDGYRDALKRLNEIAWFKDAVRLAIAIGENANKDVLADFTGNPEAVIPVQTPEALNKAIRVLSVRSCSSTPE